MILTLRSWYYAPMLRRAYTTSTTFTQLQYARIDQKRFNLPTISTLCPEKLVHSDFLVLAGSVRPQFHTKPSLLVPAKNKSRDGRPTRISYEVYGKVGTKTHEELAHEAESQDDDETTTAGTVTKEKFVPFPKDSQGFLYLYQPPPDSHLPRQASSIRFRCVPSLVEASSSYMASLKHVQSMPRSEPLHFLPSSITNPEIYEAFKAGYDLNLPSQIPWNIPIVVVAGRPTLEYIRLQLLKDKYFDESELRGYEGIYQKTNYNWRGNLLHTLDDVFSIKFNKTLFRVWAAGERRKANETKKTYIKPLMSIFPGLFMDWRSGYDGVLPYTGAATVHFELAPDSDPKDPAICLRIVKIIEPVKCVLPDYDGYIHMPKEGELVTHGEPGEAKPWTCELNSSVAPRSSILSLVPK